MTYKLLIAEKPQANLKIAEALADGKVEKKQEEGIAYYKIKHNGEELIVASAVGHLFGLTEENKKKGWTYPVFDLIWKPIYQISKASDYVKAYIDALKKLSKEAKEIIVCCDFDIEGSLIGYNCVRFIAEKKDAKRMKFSTLTKDELNESYEKAMNHLDWPQIEAGETRHYADFFWGVSLSRALTLAIKTTGRFKILSTGRVQGPALKLVVDRELEIRKFKPIPYWEIQLLGKFKKQKLEFWHQKDKFWEKKEADDILKRIKDKKAIIDKITKKIVEQLAPTPFDLTTLQLEAYRCFKLNPKKTLELAQNLYLQGVISYPRTSSQELPESLNYNKIIKSLAKQENYKELCTELLKKKLVPRNGLKKDPAHPAIYATGEIPKNIGTYEAKIYDMVVRRTLATFADKAVKENIHVLLDVNKEPFVTSGMRVIEEGWYKFYDYVKVEEIILPDFKEKDEIKVDEINLHEKETQPPKRYNSASILKELEKLELGTKATRAEIINTLYQRNYVMNESIEATELGMKTIETLGKYCPDIIDEKLTRHFEHEMEQIQEGKIKKEKVLEEAKEVLTKISNDFRKKESEIGKALLDAVIETQNSVNLVGQCPNCKEGSLMLRKGKFGNFVACNKYPECKTTYNLPNVMIRASKKVCKVCGFPTVISIKGRRAQEICFNSNCKGKEIEKELLEEKRTCPKCGKTLVIKKGPYSAFFACPGYPECKYIEAIKKKK